MTTQSKGTIAAGITGVVLGAAGAIALLLSDEEIRKKTLHKAKEFRDIITKLGENTTEEVSEKGEEVTKKIEKKVSDAEDTSERITQHKFN